MEERAAGGKDKKYVLYTVVNNDKLRTGCGVWAVRILLGTLLLIALAVVPYVSLRLAQDSDRTLVVFQPYPVHNRSRSHHYRGELHASVNSPSSHTPAKKPVTHELQSASLLLDNFTTEMPKSKHEAKTMANDTVVTLHESAVTLALLEDVNNATHPLNGESNNTGKVDSAATHEKINISNGAVPSTLSSLEIKNENNNQSKGDDKESLPLVTVKVPVNENVSVVSIVLDSEVQSYGRKESLVLKSTTIVVPLIEKEFIASTDSSMENTPILLKMLKDTTIFGPTTTFGTTTSRPVQTHPSTKQSGVSHKLAYLATASSGNHVGGFCVWKNNKNVTKWAYFYDNIPIEFQSHQDNTDHEMRAIIVAIRLWSPEWYDYHVIIRSHHSAIKGSKHPTRIRVTEELEKKSDEHFTYELEYRLGRDDTLVKIANCLARLYKSYDHWFKEFQNNVDQYLGKQDWSVSKIKNHIKVSEDLFFTDTKPERDEEFGDLNSLAFE